MKISEIGKKLKNIEHGLHIGKDKNAQLEKYCCFLGDVILEQQEEIKELKGVILGTRLQVDALLKVIEDYYIGYNDFGGGTVLFSADADFLKEISEEFEEDDEFDEGGTTIL